MKNLIKQSFVLFLALSILLTSTGITVYKMVCSSSKKEVVSFNQIRNCCDNKSNEESAIEKKCCDFSTQTFKINLLQKNESSAFAPFFIPEKTHSAFADLSFTFQLKKNAITLTPLCLSGRKILQLNSCFLI